jgi:hypothetical protein
VQYDEGQVITREVTFRLLNEDNESNPAVLGKPDSTWGIVNWGVV